MNIGPATRFHHNWGTLLQTARTALVVAEPSHRYLLAIDVTIHRFLTVQELASALARLQLAAKVVRARVRPVFLDEAVFARTSWPDRCPLLGHFLECRPQRVLPFVINQHAEFTVFVVNDPMPLSVDDSIRLETAGRQ